MSDGSQEATTLVALQYGANFLSAFQGRRNTSETLVLLYTTTFCPLECEHLIV